MGPGGGMGPGDGMGGGGQGQGMGFGGGVGPGPGGVGPEGIGPFGRHPGIPPQAGGLGMGAQTNLGPDVVTARFVRVSSDASLDIGIPPAASDSCASYFQGPQGNADLFVGPVQFLDAGNLDVAGPGVNLTLTPETVGAGTLYAASLPTPLEQGTYTVTGNAGADVGAFGPISVSVPPLVAVTTSLEAGTVVSRQAGLMLNWTGGNPDDLVLIHGRSFFIPPDTQRPVGAPMQFSLAGFRLQHDRGRRCVFHPRVCTQQSAGRAVDSKRHAHAVG